MVMRGGKKSSESKCKCRECGKCNEGVVIDMKDGGHIMYVNPGSILNERTDRNECITHIYDDTKQIFSVNTKDIVNIHWIPRHKNG